MQIVIDIPEDLKKMIFDDDVFDIAHSYRLAMCVKNGTPLPKGHGRLIDADDLFDNTCIDEIPTIIEADKAEGSEKG